MKTGYRYYILITSWFLLSVSLPSFAQFEQYSKREIGHSSIFKYQWRDHDNNLQQISFELPFEQMRKSAGEFTKFNNKDAHSYVLDRLKTFAKNYSVGSKKVSLFPQSNGYKLRTIGYSQHEASLISAEISKKQKQLYDEYVAIRGYSFVDGDTIMPNHRQIALDYSKKVLPIAKAVSQYTPARDARSVINYLASFMQQIPYDELRDRYTSGGAGFLTPFGLLEKNKGDCDTKTVALAAVLRALYPSTRLMVVYTPSHAFLGVQMAQGQNDYALKIDGDVFVLVDPAGPRLSPLGEISLNVQHALNNGRYSYQEVGF